MDDLLTPVSDTVPALVEGPEVAAVNGAGSKPSSSKAMIVFENVRKVYEPDVVALDRPSFVIGKGEVPSVGGAPVGGGECAVPRAAPKGAGADGGADHRRRPCPDPTQALEGAAAPPQR